LIKDMVFPIDRVEKSVPHKRQQIEFILGLALGCLVVFIPPIVFLVQRNRLLLQSLNM